MLARTIQTAANSLATAGLLLLLAFAFCTLCDGVLRAFANYPLDFVRELGDLIAALAATSCLPLTILKRGNITLRLLDSVFSPRLVRVIDSVNSAVITVILAGMAWQFWLYAMKSFRAGETTWLLNVPKAPFWFAVDAMFWLALIVQISLLMEDAFANKARP